jgi:hypothetical protein
MNRKWTPELSEQWQQYYNTAPRFAVFVRNGEFDFEDLGILPKYKDLEPVRCEKSLIPNNADIVYQNTFIIFFFFLILIFVA